MNSADALVKVFASKIRQIYAAYRLYRDRRDVSDYYKKHGKLFSHGYGLAKMSFIKGVLEVEQMMAHFRESGSLPVGYGYGFDERVVEYPWVLSRLVPGEYRILDAGSALNNEVILLSRQLVQKRLSILTLAPENYSAWNKGISYLYEDLRSLPFRDGWFDYIISISTLEHIGMNNIFYTKGRKSLELNVGDYLSVVLELRRVLKPAGRLLITVPFGRYENHGWLQQFDREMVENILRVFSPCRYDIAYYRYNGELGWNVAEAASCEDSHYIDRITGSNIHLDSPNPAVAAGAITCIDLIK